MATQKVRVCVYRPGKLPDCSQTITGDSLRFTAQHAAKILRGTGPGYVIVKSFGGSKKSGKVSFSGYRRGRRR